jgi:hypothetical protein
MPKVPILEAKKAGNNGHPPDPNDDVIDIDFSTPLLESDGRNIEEEEKRQQIPKGKSKEPESVSQEKKDDDISDEELATLNANEMERYKFKDRRFPTPMGEEAFIGIAGEIVNIIAPVSEASKEATLAQFLVGIGNLLGRGLHRKQAGIHHLNEDTVLVGDTAIARKGSSWVPLLSLFTVLNEEWCSTRIKDGFQSGESIIHAVRDAIYGIIPVNKRKAGEADVAEETLLDEGVDDKRLLMHEEEFGRLLTVASRVGNTLSTTLRKAWDGKKWLYTEGKIAPEKATEAHISMIGHITVTELLDCLKAVENKNGFSNRVLWIATKRTKQISIPLWIDWRNLSGPTPRPMSRCANRLAWALRVP